MGLDILSYGRLVLEGPYPDPNDFDDETLNAIYDEGGIALPPISDRQYPEYSDDISGGIYYPKDVGGGRIGSYSYYNAWRATLASMSDISNLPSFWTNPDYEHPFYYLLCFTDCDGILGARVCQTLLESFENWSSKIRKLLLVESLNEDYAGISASDFVETYEQFRDYFECAANRGVLLFC